VRPDVEALVDAALVAVMDADGKVLGTGFLVDQDGTVLTCHHVIDGQETVRLRGPGGSTGEAGQAAIAAAPEIDLALIRTSSVRGTPLPVTRKTVSLTEYWAKGYHGDETSIRAALPVEGRITGSTSITYKSRTSTYAMDSVFVLRDDPIEPGLSGAPVLDLAAGVVVGVVSTKYVHGAWNGGFAIPIAHAARSEVLAETVQQNEVAVPAFGAYLNAPAARDLCAMVTDSEIDTLAQLRNVDLGARIPRIEIEAAMASFLDGDAPIFALVGQSGVGKSTEVAALARRLPGRVLLLRGSSLSRESTGLSEAIRAALNGAGSKFPLPEDVDEAVARALLSDAGLIVVLDALNEAPFNGQTFEEWVASTRSWLRNTPARLVISCRSELWGDLIGRSLGAPLDGRQPIVVSLAGFNNDEYHAAARAYGITTGVDRPIMRMPLVLSLCSRYQPGEARSLDAEISLNKAIEAYVEETARHLAIKGPGSPLSPQVMRTRLAAIAGVMWERGVDLVDLASFGDLFGTTAIVDDLVSEGVIIPTPSGYRFVYDDVSDWLQAQTLDLESELTAILRGDRSSWRLAGPIASALRDVESRDGHEALHAQLMRLVQSCGRVRSLAFRIAEGTLGKISGAQPYRDVLDLMADLTIAALSDKSPHNLDRLLGSHLMGFWRSVPLPLPQYLELLRRLSQLEHYYHWRSKDWVRLKDWPQEENLAHDYAALVYSLVSESPATGIPALTEWLDDSSPLLGGEATISDVAAGILYKLRFERMSLIWNALTDAGRKSWSLLGQISADDPGYVARMIIAGPDTAATDQLVIYAAGLLLGKQVRPELLQAVYDTVSKRYGRGLDRQSEGAALNVLIQTVDGESYVNAVVDAYQSGVPYLNEWTLVEAGAYGDGKVVLPILVSALNKGGEPRKRALAALAYSQNANMHVLGDRAVRQHVEQSGNVDLYLCRFVEERIWHGHMADEDLLAVINLVIQSPPGSDRNILAYTLVSSNGLSDPAQRAGLMREFIEASDDPESMLSAASALVRVIISDPQGSDFSELFELLRQTLARIDGPAADFFLFERADSRRTEFAGILAAWLTTKKLPPPGPYMSRFQALVESGEDPEHALEQMMDSEMRQLGDKS
jgi:hypothetical protein